MQGPHTPDDGGSCRLPLFVDKALGTQAAPLQRTLALSAGWSADAVWAASHGEAAAGTAGDLPTQGADLSCESVDLTQGRLIRMSHLSRR